MQFTKAHATETTLCSSPTPQARWTWTTASSPQYATDTSEWAPTD